MKSILYALGLVGGVQGFFAVEVPDILDATTQAGRQSMEEEGFDLSEPPYTRHFKLGLD